MLDRSGYRRMLLDSTDPEDQERLANIEELITAAKQFAAEDPARTIGDFLENITLASDVDGWDEKQDCVSVMTMHAAKGLEFPVVYMMAMEQGCCRTSAAWAASEEIEEERRLAFVGMTRAKEELYLCHARLREFRGNTMYAVPSMFLDELPKAVQTIDLSASGAGTMQAIEHWRGGGAAAEQGWSDAGVRPRTAPIPPRQPARTTDAATPRACWCGTHVWPGRIIEVSGNGSLRKVKIRFQTRANGRSSRTR